MNHFILHIETATKVCSVALSNKGEILFVKETDESEYVHGECITLFIEEILKNANISASQLCAVSVTSGPGSYTGLRIGVSTAKGLCYALNIPLISVNSLENLAVLTLEKYPNSKVCTMIDARRMEVYSAIFNQNLSIEKEISPDILDEYTYQKHEPFIAVGDGINKVEELWKNRNIQFDFSVKSSAKGHAQLAYSKYLNEKFEDVAYFEPYYLKDFVSTNKK